MGILNKGGKKKFRCQQDPETGALRCESFKEFEDQTTQSLASVDFSFDAECRPVPSNIVENEEGELARLEKRALPLLRMKCKNKPKDY